MSFLLDADTCSANLRQVAAIQNRFLQYTGRLYLPTVTVAELGVWVLRKNTAAKYVTAFNRLLQDVVVLPLDGAMAMKASQVGADLRDQGFSMGFADLLIAATALVQGFTLVTHNTRHFVHVPGLSVVDWLIP